MIYSIRIREQDSPVIYYSMFPSKLCNWVLDTKSIFERYYDLENTYPGIQQRVTQKVIATYLRTTPVHLSRIKKSKFKS